MKWSEYETQSERTEKKFPEGLALSQEQMELLHAAIGISTEAGEILDAFKKHLIYGKDLDLVNVGEEIGDIMWYVAIITRYLGKDFYDLLDINIEKLSARYPEKFTTFSALNRDLDKERDILEDGLAAPEIGC